MKFFVKALDETFNQHCFLTIYYKNNDYTYIEYNGTVTREIQYTNLFELWYSSHIKRLSK